MKWYLIGILFLLFSACTKDHPIAVDTSKEFYPMALNNYWIYNVDSISFDDVTLTSDTIHYQVMETLDSTFIDDTNQQAYRLERSRRADSSAAWTITDVWSCNLSNTTAEKVEENLRFIKLSFPVYENKTWAGNKYIHPWDVTEFLSNWSYIYNHINESTDVLGQQFDSTLTVIQKADSNLTEKYFFTEKYARHIGMIFKEEQHVQKQNLLNSWLHPESGFIIRYYLIDHN